MPDLTPRTTLPLEGLLPAPATLPAPLPDVAGGETHLLPRSAWSDTGNPLKVTFPAWENSSPSDKHHERIRVLLGQIEVATKEWSAPIAPDDLFVTIPSEKLPAGEHLLTYIVTVWTQVDQGSFPFTITVDKEAPLLVAQANALVFPPEVASAITSSYLAAHDDQVLASIPAYTDKKVGDVITWYWEASPQGSEAAGSLTVTADNLSAPLQAAFLGDVLRARENGERFATYRVSDRAGNESTLSTAVKLSVAIRPPEARRHPTVKQIAGSAASGTLDPLRNQAGVTVVVPAEHIDPGEVVTVDFIGQGGENGLGSITGVQPISAGGLEFAISPALLAANIPVNNDGRKVSIYYWAGADVQHSEVYTLNLSALNNAQLPRINCKQAQTGSPATLSKNAVPSSGANLELPEWPFQATGQLMKVWADAAGTRTYFQDGTSLSTKGTFRSLLPKSYVQARTLNTSIKVGVSVSFDRGASYFDFQTLSLKILA